MNILLYVAVSIAVSLICHFRFDNYFVSSVISAVILDIGFHVLNYMILGYVDPFVIISFIVGFVVFLLIALVSGLPVMYFRSRKSLAEKQ